MASESKRIKTAEKVVSLLEFLHENGESTLAEVSAHMGLTKSTTHSYLETLVEREMILKRDRRYGIGLKPLEFGGQVRSETRVYRASKAQLHGLHAEVGNTVLLAVEECNDLVLLERINPQETIEFGGHVGRRSPFHRGALGKAILAHLPEEKVQVIIEKHGLPPLTEKSITAEEELYAELAEVRERGYAVNNEEEHKNFLGIAYPILVDAEVVGAISVAGSKTKLKMDEEAIHNGLQSAVDVIEIDLQYG